MMTGRGGHSTWSASAPGSLAESTAWTAASATAGGAAGAGAATAGAHSLKTRSRSGRGRGRGRGSATNANSPAAGFKGRPPLGLCTSREARLHRSDEYRYGTRHAHMLGPRLPEPGSGRPYTSVSVAPASHTGNFRAPPTSHTHKRGCVAPFHERLQGELDDRAGRAEREGARMGELKGAARGITGATLRCGLAAAARDLRQERAGVLNARRSD